MAAASFECPKCHTELEASPEPAQLECTCPKCDSQLLAWFFSPLFRSRAVGASATSLIDQSEASCFYHPQKQAAQVCDGCGRLICSLCSVELGAEHLCPSCISAGRRKGKITSLEGSRTCYDRIAMSLAIVGILFYAFSIVLAPIAIYVAIRHWNSPGSLLGVSKNRYVIAIIIASLELTGWLIFILAAIFSHK